jgi:signal recognition particle subunit SRP54
VFESLTERFSRTFTRLKGKGRLTQADLRRALREVRLALLDADVNVEVVNDLCERIRKRSRGAEVAKSLTPGQQVIKIVHSELVRTMGQEPAPLQVKGSPLTMMLMGLQGSGKTTTSAKVALHLRERYGKRPLLVAADLQRPAAVEQLVSLGERAGVDVYREAGASNPRRVVRSAMRHARGRGYDAVVIDTAGRLQIDKKLMGELAAMAEIARPEETLLVVDAMTGQDAVNVARGFAERVDLTGIVLSKLDGDARGGAAISVTEATGQKVKLVGEGEELSALAVFHPDRMASRILGMGDVLTLIEKAEAVTPTADADKFLRGAVNQSLGLDDFLEQLHNLKRMGGLNSVLAMMPGGARSGMAGLSDEEMRRTEGIIHSMTPQERRNPKLITGSRRRRIANGSGTTVAAVNRLLKRFADTQKMMNMLSGGTKIPGMGMEGILQPTRTRRRRRKR